MMHRIRFRLRTIMIAIAVLAVMMCVLRSILLVYDFFGPELLFFAFVNLSLFVFLPVLTIVEFLFFVGYFWFRRKRGAQTLMPRRLATPEPGLSGEPKGV
jgi:hypothetical protein